MVNLFQDLRTGEWLLILSYTECLLFYRKFQWDFKNTSLGFTVNLVNGVKIKLYIIKPVGNKFSGFLVILDSGD